MYNVIVIGGGPAGMMAAGTAAQKGAKVLLLEKMDRPGRKLCLTGKGRCNMTNLKGWSDFEPHVHPLSRTFKTAFYHFTPEDTVRFFNDLGLPTVLEHGDRVYPQSYVASDVLHTLRQWMESVGVTLLPSAAVTSFDFRPPHIESLKIRDNKGASVTLEAQHYLLATGGLSYPVTGSTGDGYALAQSVGHTLVPAFPALTALMPAAYDSALQGISLKNVELSLYIDNQLKRTEMGELQFTPLGVEGALAFRLSRQAVVALNKGQQVELQLNLKPAVPAAELRARWHRDLTAAHRDSADPALLRGYLPKDLIAPYMKYCNTARVNPVEALQNWRFPVASYGDWARCVVTAGGISMNEVNTKTMRSKLVDNLSFAGEILDLDADTGGYNLQIAFSTGRLAGEQCV